MIYKNFHGEHVSALGFGCMRFPVVDGKENEIDVKKATELIDIAIKGGINYFDTAYGYHGGTSEAFVGEALSRYPRSSYKLATKFPGYTTASFGHHEEIFKKQLENCRTDYFDFYLMHCVSEANISYYLDAETYGTVEFYKKQKRLGKIRHLGFSAHASLETMERFLEMYGDDMEFCQIQLNYLDWDFQRARDKVELLKKYNIPVWVMEPVRGGRLVDIGEEQTKKLSSIREGETAVAMAFRFIQSVPGVVVTLSGMSDKQQLLSNLQTFSTDAPTTEAENKKLFEVAESITGKTFVPCTGCRYCTAYCPSKLDIPYLLKQYNEKAFTRSFEFVMPDTVSELPEEKQPISCIGCKSCEKVCPQQIKISKVMDDFKIHK